MGEIGEISVFKINSSISRKFMRTFAALIVVSSLLFSVSFYYISMGIISQNVLPQFDKVLLTSTQDIYKRLDTNQAMQLMSGKENSRFAVESYLTKSAKEFHLNNAYLIQLQENGAAVIAANENSGMKAGDPLEIQAAMAETSDGEIHISELYSDRFGSHKTAFIAIPGSKAVLAIGLDATFIDQKRAEILQICIGITALVIGAGLLVAYFVSRRITKSIKKLVAVTEKMAGGDFRQAIEVAGHDEVAQLAASFRTMTNQLKEMFAKVLDTSQTVVSGSEHLSRSVDTFGELITRSNAATREIESGSLTIATAAAETPGRWKKFRRASSISPPLPPRSPNGSDKPTRKPRRQCVSTNGRRADAARRGSGRTHAGAHPHPERTVRIDRHRRRHDYRNHETD
ncbi:hypothetical protein HMSSN036_26030 [Paenibacillus macerans]|nr:hypothetical protein HMSSN036_26030 [Paenibacillus macerans]